MAISWLRGNSAINKLKKSENISIPKYFVMPHGMLDPYFQKDPERKLKAIRNILYWKVIESKNINNATGVLFTCETELFLAKKTFKGYFPKKELNVGYGIKPPPLMGLDMRNALLKICPGVENKSYVLFLSRIHPKKGVDLLIKAYNELSISGNLPLLIIAGPGMESNYGRYLTQMVKKHPHLINKIFFTGMLSGNEKWGAFYGCDAFILPSHQENFGISVVEAMACGKPVLISNQVNIYVEIEASEAGIIADDTLEGTKLMLSEWLGKSKDNQIKMGLNAEQLFRDNYTFSEVANRFYSAINN